MHRSAPLLLVVVACAGGCAGRPALREARVEPVVRYEVAAGAHREDPSPQDLHIGVHALAEPVDGPAVATQALAFPSETGAPFRGASPLPPGTRWLTGDAVLAWQRAMEERGPAAWQPLGTARATAAAGLATAVQPGLLGVPELHFERHGGGVRVRLVHVAANGARRGVLLRDVLLPDAHALLYVPVGGGALAGHALLVHARPAAEAAVAAAFAQATVAEPAGLPLPAPWRQAFAAVGEHNRRPALLAIARPLGCLRAADVLLTADEAALVAITAELAAVPPAAPDVAWRVERALWQALLPRVERDELPPAMRAALHRHLGALAHEPATLRLAATTAADASAFAAALADGNREALADRDPAARVRAHEWLAARGLAVAGYDPLAPAAARRATLRHGATPAAADEAGR